MIIDIDIETAEILEEFKFYRLKTKNNKESSVQKYLIDLRLFFNQVNKDPDSITIDDIENYCYYLKVERKNAINTQRKKRIAIHLFFDWYSTKYRVDNPARDLSPLQEEVKIPNMPTPDDIIRMIHACDVMTFIGRRNAALICLLADTGIRIGECAALNLGRVKVIDKSFLLTVPPIKSRERRIPFGKLIKQTLIGEHFAAYFLEIRFKENYKLEDPLFKQHGPVHRGGRLSAKGIRAIIDKYARRAGVEGRITPHSFRHFFGTYSSIYGTPPQRLRYLMGHAWLESTMRYVHLAEDVDAASLETRATAHMESDEHMAAFVKIVREMSRKGAKC